MCRPSTQAACSPALTGLPPPPCTPNLQQSQRNDAPFFTSVALLFVVPPAVILAAAFASGYLDQLDRYGLMR